MLFRSRYAATFATLLFSPLVGGAIAIGQSFSNKNSPNGLNAVQQKLMTMKLTPEQRKRAKKVFDDIAKKGSGGLSAITKGVTNFLGLTSDKEKGEKETDFEKFLRTGNVKGANNELNNARNKNPQNQKVFEHDVRDGTFVLCTNTSLPSLATLRHVLVHVSCSSTSSATETKTVYECLCVCYCHATMSECCDMS